MHEHYQEPEKLPVRRAQELWLLSTKEVSLEVGQRVAQRKAAEEQARKGR